MNNHATEPYQNPDNRRETQPSLVSLSNEFFWGLLQSTTITTSSSTNNLYRACFIHDGFG